MKWVFLSLLLVFESVADIFAKEFSLYSKMWVAFLAIFFYIVCNTFWLFSLKAGITLSQGGAIFSVGSAIAAALIGLFLYKEVITVSQWLGIGLGIVSLYLIIK